MERSISIASAPQTVFPLINDFHNWTMWSPWEGLDPAMKRTYGNVSAGTGAEYSWVGNDKVGEGKMTILESKPDSLVKIKLEFIKPFEETSETTFTIAPQGPNTQVTWRRAGHNNFIAKVMSVFMDFEKMIGGDFDKGLGNLKGAAEKGAAPPSDTGPAPGETTAPPSGAPTPPGPSPTSN